MKKETTYWAGNKVEYTGNVVNLYSGTFYEVKILDGHEKGKIKHIKNPPKN
jgi:hypothetical protein